MDQQLRCHGLVSLKGLTYLRRNTDLRQAVKALIDEKLVQGTLEQVQVGSGEVFILETGTLEHPLPRLSNRMLILSPFDNAVIQRQRLNALFQFDYQIECYVPAAKRQYGYFSLPLLYRGEFVGRMDCKAHRKTRHLEIKFLSLEQHFLKQHFLKQQILKQLRFEEDLVFAAFAEAIRQFRDFQQCDSVSLTQTEPKNLRQSFGDVLKFLA